MVRETSRKAYDDLVATGKLKGQLAELLKMVVSSTGAPSTVAELVNGTSFDENLNCTRARFTELQQRGLIREVGQRMCRVTGKLALTWSYTGRSAVLGEKRKHVKTDAKKWKAIAKAMAIQLKGCEVGSPNWPSYRAFVDANGGEP
jgi:hypothetical protein